MGDVNRGFRSGVVLNAEVTEDSVLLKIGARRLEELFSQSLKLANWGRKLAEHYLSEYEHYFIWYSGTKPGCSMNVWCGNIRT